MNTKKKNTKCHSCWCSTTVSIQTNPLYSYVSHTVYQGSSPTCIIMKILDIWKFTYLHSFTWMFIWTQFIDQLPVGLLAQLVERCTSIAEVMGSNPVRAWNFFQVLFTTTRFSSVLSYKDLLISSLHHSANIWIFIYLKSGLFFIAHNICLISPSFWRQNG